MTAAPDAGYVNYFSILGVSEDAKPGDVRKEYRSKMKALVTEIHQKVITPQLLAHYTLEMAKLNAALVILREMDDRQAYWNARKNVMELEVRWIEAVQSGSGDTDRFRREFEAACKDFLSRYVEELMLAAGRDKECVEASGWNPGQERHATRILRHYRHLLNLDILKRLPYTEVTSPHVDWQERERTVAALVAAKGN